MFYQCTALLLLRHALCTSMMRRIARSSLQGSTSARSLTNASTSSARWELSESKRLRVSISGLLPWNTARFTACGRPKPLAMRNRLQPVRNVSRRSKEPSNSSSSQPGPTERAMRMQVPSSTILTWSVGLPVRCTGSYCSSTRTVKILCGLCSVT